MATKTQVTLVDDLDNESPADETVHFALDGRQYEIDLSDYHAKALRENLADYVQAARVVARGAIKAAKTARATTVQSRADHRAQLQAIRDWANVNGHSIGNRGRIPNKIVDAFNAAH